ncbi:MAG: hypothetical protein ACC656_14280 [Candidatus Heimdallarchaeota archaeon]
MEWETVFKLVTASIASIGMAGAIIFALSSWLGKVWANRILGNEKHKLGIELEKTKRDLDVVKETILKFQNDKILTYRAVIDVISRLLASFDTNSHSRLGPKVADERFDEFNEQRIKMYGYLAMLAPQAVMDTQDKLMDHLFKIYNNKISYEWNEVRSLAIKFLNEIRNDIGIDKNPISYNGEL